MHLVQLTPRATAWPTKVQAPLEGGMLHLGAPVPVRVLPPYQHMCSPVPPRVLSKPARALPSSPSATGHKLASPFCGSPGGSSIQPETLLNRISGTTLGATPPYAQSTGALLLKFDWAACSRSRALRNRLYLTGLVRVNISLPWSLWLFRTTRRCCLVLGTATNSTAPLVADCSRPSANTQSGLNDWLCYGSRDSYIFSQFLRAPQQIVKWP